MIRRVNLQRFLVLTIVYIILGYGIYTRLLSGWSFSALFVTEFIVGFALGSRFSPQIYLIAELVLAIIASAFAVHFYFSWIHSTIYLAVYSGGWQFFAASTLITGTPILIIWLFKWINRKIE